MMITQAHSSDCRRPLAAIDRNVGIVDVLLVNPESTFYDDTNTGALIPAHDHDARRLSRRNTVGFMGDSDLEPNHGILTVAAMLRKHGLTVELVDLNSNAALRRLSVPEGVDGEGASGDVGSNLLVRMVDQLEPRVVGFSTMAPNLPRTLELAAAVRSSSPVPIVLGGIGSSGSLIHKRLALASIENLVTFVGEFGAVGVDLFMTLARKGVVDAPVVKEQEPQISCAGKANAVLPAWDLLPRELPLLPRLFLSRGCGAGCEFCSPAAALEYRVERGGVDSFMERLVEVHSVFDFSHWLLGDLTLHLQNRPARDLVGRMSSMSLRPWWCQTQVRFFDLDMAHRLASAKCVETAMGIEDYETTLQSVRRKHRSRSAAELALQNAHESGISTQTYWMFGLPSDEVSACIRRINVMSSYAEKQLVDAFHISYLVPYPGTPFFESASRYGLKIDYDRFNDFIGPRGGYYNVLPLHSTEAMSAEQIFLCTRLAISSVSSALGWS